MCGFAGYINNYATFDKAEVIKAMADRIVHRGPDDAHYYVDDDISLGFRRLSIIDLEGGRQPILNEDQSKVLMFNGEIYNFQELRAELEAEHLVEHLALGGEHDDGALGFFADFAADLPAVELRHHQDRKSVV